MVTKEYSSHFFAHKTEGYYRYLESTETLQNASIFKYFRLAKTIVVPKSSSSSCLYSRQRLLV